MKTLIAVLSATVGMHTDKMIVAIPCLLLTFYILYKSAKDSK
jgi:hypothetical protein